MAKFRAGKTGRVQFNAGGEYNMTAKGWTTSLDGDELDTSSFESASITTPGVVLRGKTYLIGMSSLSWTIDANWDAAKNPLDQPPGLYVRDDGTLMKLFSSTADGRFWSMPTWMCSGCNMAVNATGIVSFKANGKAQDNFVLITGSNP